MNENDVKLDQEAQERHAKAMQWLREKCIRSIEQHQHLFPEAEAELKQAEAQPGKPKVTRTPRHAVKRVRRQAKNLTR